MTIRLQAWRIARRLLLIASGAVFLAGSAVFAGEQVMIVLDGSGSMWGQIGGKAKISIARDVLSDVLSKADPSLEMGLMSYGHREKGQCSDIEMILAPAANNGANIAAASNKISPLGKTPLTDAVRMAAETLKYTEDKATVILITDGIETCRADPCALGDELEKLGVDFTAHVVGFGLSAEEGQKVSCLAEQTGGLYVQADDAAALSEALSDRVAELAAPAPEEAPPEIDLPEVTISSVESVEIGQTFTVMWDGPQPTNRDAIVLWDANSGPDGRRVTERRVVNGDVKAQSVDLVAPVRPDTYTLRYVFGPSREIVATAQIEVIDAEVSLDAPATVEVGRPFATIWKGPGARRDEIQMIDPNAGVKGDKLLKAKRLVNDDYDNRSLTLEAPAEAGFYRLQYWNGDNREVLATREIEVLEAETSLDGPASATIGSTIEVAWVGPGARRDEVQIFDPLSGPDGKVVYLMRLVNGDYDGRMVKLVVPVEPGDYELRYYSGENRAVMATAPLVVKDAEVGLDGPETAEMGSTITVGWTGPGARRDEVQIFDPLSGPDGKVVYFMRLVNGDYDGRSVKLIVPVETGDYELRYYSGEGRQVLATAPLAVTEAEVGLEAPASAPMGSAIEVVWAGPGARRDSVELLDDGGKVVSGERVVNGDYKKRMVNLGLPNIPGSYMLRYWSGEGRQSLFEAPITIEPVETSLDGPSSVPAGELFEVSWIGPASRRDEVQVFDPDKGSNGQSIASARVVNSDMKAMTVRIKAPKQAGSYKLRYYGVQDGVVLFETDITVE